MPSLNELRFKINGIKSTQQITKAMKMIAGARLAKAQKQAQESRFFIDDIQPAMAVAGQRYQALCHDLGSKISLFQADPTGQQTAVIVVTSDKGLCGGFNASVIRQSMEFVRSQKADTLEIVVIGRRGQDFFRRIQSAMVVKEYVNIFSGLNLSIAEQMARDIADLYASKKYRQVIVFYNESKSIMRQIVRQQVILPISFPQEDKIKQVDQYVFEPADEQMFERLSKLYLKAQIMYILRVSYASELAARMTAMDNASRNAQKLIEELTLVMNNIRQANITRELSEIVAAGEALK